MLQTADAPQPAMGRGLRQQGGCSLTFSEALASLEPVELKVRAARGPSWAGMVQAVFCRAEDDMSSGTHCSLGCVRAGHCLSHTPSRPADMGSWDPITLRVSSTPSALIIFALPSAHSTPTMATVITEDSLQGQRSSAPHVSRLWDRRCALSVQRQSWQPCHPLACAANPAAATAPWCLQAAQALSATSDSSSEFSPCALLLPCCRSSAPAARTEPQPYVTQSPGINSR